MRKTATAVAVTAAVIAASLLTTSGSAAADPMGRGRFMLCAREDTYAQLKFRGTPPPVVVFLDTVLVRPGACIADYIQSGVKNLDVYVIGPGSIQAIRLSSHPASAAMNPGLKIYTHSRTVGGSTALWVAYKTT
ncbi:hypothetical protein ABT369_25810 [Dactylosporangium sp. NPDC000244]|uniref:hypothetical protein n=1 Tax=Dactylosporangium sp. NPDC000244 TaxID=3154365 RepID=UPI0033316F60